MLSKEVGPEELSLFIYFIVKKSILNSSNFVLPLLGHVYSVLACIESILPLFASPIFNLVYKATLSTFLGTVFLLDAILVLILAALFLLVEFIP